MEGSHTSLSIHKKPIITPPFDYMVWIGYYEYEPWHPKFEIYSSLNAVISKGVKPKIIVLSAALDKQDSILLSLKSHHLTFNCFTLVKQKSSLSPYLSDGLWIKNFNNDYQKYIARKKQIKLNNNDKPAYKLLSYLWLHNNSIITPKSSPSNSFIYFYPLLKSWGINEKNTTSWLNNLENKNWIEKHRLINRLRLCPSCHSGHLNYIDVCPQCHSIDIEHQASLHCFNCGHVDCQTHFRKLTALSCPNCLQNLRHIGVDYDRPIENQHCKNCDSLFIDALVEAACLDCQTSSRLDDLHVHNVYSYKLTTQGRDLVRHGHEKPQFSLTLGEQMSREQFYWLIDWQNKLAIRHKKSHSILSIQFQNVAELLSSKGEAKGFAQLDAIHERIRSVIRVTDACTNYTEDRLLILFPTTESVNLKIIFKKLFIIKESQVSLKIEFSIKLITLPATIGSDVSDWLNDELIKIKPVLL